MAERETRERGEGAQAVERDAPEREGAAQEVERAFRLPDLGEGLQEAELVEWLVDVGDRVRAGDAVARVETDKAQVDVSAPWSGRVLRRVGAAGEPVAVGAPLLVLAVATPGAETGAAAAEAGSETGTGAAAEAGIETGTGAAEAVADAALGPPGHGATGAAADRPGDAGTVVGVLPEALPSSSRSGPPSASAAPRPRAARADPSHAMPAARAMTVPRAMPAARAHARALGIPLETLRGSGPEGVITRADVERAAGRRGADVHPTRVDETTEGAASPAKEEPLRGVRLAMAHHMARAHAVVVPATVLEEVDVDAWWSGRSDVTVRLVRAIAVACRAEPTLNAWLDGERLVRTLHARVDLAIAIQTDAGLFAPVLRDVGRAEARALREGIDRLARDARSRRLDPGALRDATITLSNFGAFGGRHAMLVVVPPQVAIVGAGRIEPRVVARGGRPVVRAILPLSLSFDHRAVTGAEAARFLGAMRADLESPA